MENIPEGPEVILLIYQWKVIVGQPYQRGPKKLGLISKGEAP